MTQLSNKTGNKTPACTSDFVQLKIVYVSGKKKMIISMMQEAMLSISDMYHNFILPGVG